MTMLVLDLVLCHIVTWITVTNATANITTMNTSTIANSVHISTDTVVSTTAVIYKTQHHY